MRIFNSCQPQRPACGERAVFEISLQPSEDCNARLFVIEKGTFQAWAANVMMHHRVLLSFLGLSITFFAHPPSLGFLPVASYMQVVFFWSTVARLSNNAAPAGVSGFHLIMGLSRKERKTLHDEDL